MRIILASKSPRRKALMDLARFDYEIFVSDNEEKCALGFGVEEQAKQIAFGKAKDVFDNTQGDRVIIAADTIVVKDGVKFGKPKDRTDAIRMLKELQGKEHSVYTGLAILIEEKDQYKEYKELHKVDVSLKPISDAEIIEYIETEEPFDKAGSYAIQDSFCKFVDTIYGNYTSIVGLPIQRVYEILKENEIV